MDFNDTLKRLVEYDSNLPADKQGANDPANSMSDEENAQWEKEHEKQVHALCDCGGGGSLRAADHDSQCDAQKYLKKNVTPYL